MWPVLLQLAGNLGARHDAHPTRCQLNRQRHPLDLRADRRNRLFLAITREGRLHPLGAAEKQLPRLAQQTLGQRQAGDRHQPFLAQVKPLARGNQQLDACCTLEQLGYGVSSLRQVLEVVQDQQQGAPLQVGGNLCLKIAARDLKLQALGNRRQHQLGFLHRGEGYKIDFLGNPQILILDVWSAGRMASSNCHCIKHALGGLNGEPRLADSAHAEQRQESAVWVRQ